MNCIWAIWVAQQATLSHPPHTHTKRVFVHACRVCLCVFNFRHQIGCYNFIKCKWNILKTFASTHLCWLVFVVFVFVFYSPASQPVSQAANAVHFILVYFRLKCDFVFFIRLGKYPTFVLALHHPFFTRQRRPRWWCGLLCSINFQARCSSFHYFHCQHCCYHHFLLPFRGTKKKQKLKTVHECGFQIKMINSASGWEYSVSVCCCVA